MSTVPIFSLPPPGFVLPPGFSPLIISPMQLGVQAPLSYKFPLTLSSGPTRLLIVNYNSQPLYVALGDSSVTATTSSTMVAPYTSYLFPIGSATYVSMTLGPIGSKVQAVVQMYWDAYLGPGLVGQT